LLFRARRDRWQVLPPLKPIPIKDRLSVLYVEKGHLDVLDGAFVVGTRYIQTKDIESRVVGLNLRAKAENIAGLQLADLVVSPIGRYVLGKPEQEDFSVVREKLRKDRGGEYRGFGLVVLPK
jgi:hypothetical protein